MKGFAALDAEEVEWKIASTKYHTCACSCLHVGNWNWLLLSALKKQLHAISSHRGKMGRKQGL